MILINRTSEGFVVHDYDIPQDKPDISEFPMKFHEYVQTVLYSEMLPLRYHR